MGVKITCTKCGHEMDTRDTLQKLNEELFSRISKEAAKQYPKGGGYEGTSVKRAEYIRNVYRSSSGWISLLREYGIMSMDDTK